MVTTIGNGDDVVTLLKSQHQQIRSMFAAVNDARGEERSHAFIALRRLMAMHEAAEEAIVHPAARAALPDGETVVARRLHEEREARRALYALEMLDIHSAEFDRLFRALEQHVIAHAEAEEREEFERLGNLLDPRRLARMRKVAEVTEQLAPTHEDLGVESELATMIAGSFSAMLDDARDVILDAA